jgi:hypothetical protein
MTVEMSWTTGKLPLTTGGSGSESPFNLVAVNCWPQIRFEVTGRMGCSSGSIQCKNQF